MGKIKREVSVDMSYLMTVNDPMGFIAHVLKENLEILRDAMNREFSFGVDNFEITIPHRFASVVMANEIEFINAIKDRLNGSLRVNERIVYNLIHNSGDIIRIVAIGHENLRPTDVWFTYHAADLYERMRRMEEERFIRKKLQIKEVKFNGPATIVFWTDGTKTVVKCQGDETFDPEKGVAMAIVKKVYGNEGNYYNKIKKALDESTGREIK